MYILSTHFKVKIQNYHPTYLAIYVQVQIFLPNRFYLSQSLLPLFQTSIPLCAYPVILKKYLFCQARLFFLRFSTRFGQSFLHNPSLIPLNPTEREKKTIDRTEFKLN